MPTFYYVIDNIEKILNTVLFRLLLKVILRYIKDEKEEEDAGFRGLHSHVNEVDVINMKMICLYDNHQMQQREVNNAYKNMIYI
jgi:hypothetical protein